MRYLTMAVLGIVLASPQIASATCFGCHGFRHGCHGYSRCFGCYGCWGGGSCWGGCAGGYSQVGYAYPYGSAYNGYRAYAGYYQPGYNWTPAYATRPYAYGSANWSSTASAPRVGERLPVSLEVRLPDASAGLVVQGKKTSSLGSTRTFVSPDVPVGQTYTYVVSMQRKVAGRMEEETRTIDVQAGANAVVDFTQLRVEQVPPPQSSSTVLRSP